MTINIIFFSLCFGSVKWSCVSVTYTTRGERMVVTTVYVNIFYDCNKYNWLVDIVYNLRWHYNVDFVFDKHFTKWKKERELNPSESLKLFTLKQYIFSVLICSHFVENVCKINSCIFYISLVLTLSHFHISN